MNQITVEDFDNAVKQHWGLATCIIAQVDKRLHNGLTHLDTRWKIFDSSHGAANALRVFDKHFRHPGDEQQPALQALRASLPITLEESVPKDADSVQKGN